MNEIIKEFEQSEAGKAFRCLLLEVDETIQKDVKEKTLKFLITKLKEERIKTLEEERNRIYSYIEDLLISEDNELLGKLSNIIFDKEFNNLK